MRKHGLRMAGLCLAAALSVMAFAAASAQAEVGSHWNVAGSTLSSALAEKGVVPAATLENGHGILLSHALGVELNILCTSVNFEEAKFKVEGGSLGKVRFAGCKILEGTTVLPACEPVTGTEKGVVLTNLLKDLIVLEAGGVAGEGYDLLIQDNVAEGKTPTFVTIETSAECSFGKKIPVIGEFIFKDCNLEGKVEKVTHLTEEGPGTELWVISKTVEHKATIDGSANVFLTGEHEGLKWSGTPA